VAQPCLACQIRNGEEPEIPRMTGVRQRIFRRGCTAEDKGAVRTPTRVNVSNARAEMT